VCHGCGVTFQVEFEDKAGYVPKHVLDRYNHKILQDQQQEEARKTLFSNLVDPKAAKKTKHSIEEDLKNNVQKAKEEEAAAEEETPLMKELRNLIHPKGSIIPNGTTEADAMERLPTFVTEFDVVESTGPSARDRARQKKNDEIGADVMGKELNAICSFLFLCCSSLHLFLLLMPSFLF
jgi:hypothetical protein